MDVLSASSFDDKITWYENNGSESFTAHTITTSADMAYSVYAVDMNGDGDMDVLSASAVDDKIAWYENMMIDLNVSNNDLIPSIPPPQSAMTCQNRLRSLLAFTICWANR